MNKRYTHPMNIYHVPRCTTMAEWLGLAEFRACAAKRGCRYAAESPIRAVSRFWIEFAARNQATATVMMALIPGHEAEAANLCAAAYDLCIDAGERVDAWRVLMIGREMTERHYEAVRAGR